MSLKGDLINSAYSKMRISGITTQATPEDVSLALSTLENMASEFFAKNICTDYNFEDNPDPNSPHNMKRKFWDSYASCLAFWLCSDFGKQPPQTLVLNHQKAYSFLSSVTAAPRQTQYPSRQPIGAGNSLKYNRYTRFYQPIEEAPNTCESINMTIGDINDFVEHFSSYLDTSETLSSYTLTADAGLTVLTQSLSSPDILYRIRADGSGENNSNELLQVKIIAASSTGRIETRIINFQLIDMDIT